jgi:hypothetical protein
MMKRITSDQNGPKEEINISNINFTREDFVQDSRFLTWGLQRLWLLSCD